MRLATERLLLRPLHLDDLPAYVDMMQDPETRRHFSHVPDADRIRNKLISFQQRLEEDGFHYLATEERATGKFIGVIGISRTSQAVRDAISFHPEIEIGWSLARSSWGRGYAPEGALACLDHAWKVLGAEQVVALTAVNNLPSRRVMEKVGMTYVEGAEVDHPEVPKGDPSQCHIVYRIFNPAISAA